jgi:hypothetical protein
VYNRNFVSLRIERVPEEKLEALHDLYCRLQAGNYEERYAYSLLLGSLKNRLASATYSGNCAFWVSKGLQMAGIVDKTTIWPKRLWVDVFEKYQRATRQQLIRGKFRNMNIVSYRRIPGCNSYGSDTNSFSSWVKPLHWRRAFKYADLDSFADVVVEVPSNSTQARLLVNRQALARQRQQDALSFRVAEGMLMLQERTEKRTCIAILCLNGCTLRKRDRETERGSACVFTCVYVYGILSRI